jgi:hypothetical protein
MYEKILVRKPHECIFWVEISRVVSQAKKTVEICNTGICFSVSQLKQRSWRCSKIFRKISNQTDWNPRWLPHWPSWHVQIEKNMKRTLHNEMASITLCILTMSSNHCMHWQTDWLTDRHMDSKVNNTTMFVYCDCNKALPIFPHILPMVRMLSHALPCHNIQTSVK